MGKKGKRDSSRFQFQVVLEMLKGEQDAIEIARTHDVHPTIMARWKREFLENGAAVFGKDGVVTVAARDRPGGSSVRSRLTERSVVLRRSAQPVGLLMFIDERCHRFGYQSSSAWAKEADALRRISFARRSSRFFRSSSLIWARSSLVRLPRSPASISVRRTHFRAFSREQPILLTIKTIADH